MKTVDTIEPHNILIVEDDKIMREMIGEAISQQHHVKLASSASQVMPILEKQRIDMVILDLMLPDIDGLELLDIIRSRYSPEELVIIIMSAVGSADSIVSGFERGANDYIVKPVEVSVMLARIKTHLKLLQLQDERNHYIKHLEKGEKLRKQLNQIASHDLKNPLNNLRIAEGLLQEELSDVPRLRQLLKTIGVSLDMMEEVVDAFLDMVAIQTQSIQLKSEPVRIRDVINNAYTQYELAADKKNIKMLMGSTEGTIIADGGRMAQIAGNLVSNAIKYSPIDSSIMIWSEIHDDILRLCVSDSGQGIPEAERHLLFTEFGKLSTRPTDGEGSTGLGLWIVKHLIELQGGSAGADFPDGTGSIFWVKMPLAP